MTAYGARPTKYRRTKAEINIIKAAIIEALEADAPMTVRQVFYRLVSVGAIAKTEAEYKQTAGRLLTEMRRDGTIPYGAIADATRWMRKPTTYDSAEEAVRAVARHYRQNVWRDLQDYVEVWCEKDALAGVLVEVTAEYDVPLMVTKGYPSLTYLYSAAETIAAKYQEKKRITIYYLGDYDPSGVDIRRNVEEQLNELAAEIVLGRGWAEKLRPLGAEADRSHYFDFEVLAVEPWQIEAFGLLTRPTKQTDSRAAGFAGESVELDAIAPTELRRIVRDAIEDHLPEGALDSILVAEASEREILRNIAKTMGGQAA